MSDSSYDYEHRKGVHPISWEMVHAICKGLEPDDRFLIGVTATPIAKGQSIDAP